MNLRVNYVLNVMADIVTHFPPQTYSSSFFLNSINEDEKKTKSQNDEKPKESSTILDCFIKTFLFGDKRSGSSKATNHRKKSSEKDFEVVDFWKSRHGKTNNRTAETTRRTFNKWRKSSSAQKSESNLNANKITTEALAINALDLSAPASDVLLKSRSTNWFQLSGHPDSLAPAGPGTVWKKRSGGPDDTERVVYEELSQDPAIKDIIPKYYREVEYQGEKFIELQDLLHEFNDPYVIDIKMGTRTFLESEVKKTNAREDLYQKMIAIDPSAPTSDEHELKAVTKLRYMQFRELQSSSSSHGFRIEAMKCRGLPPVTDLKKVKSRDKVLQTLDTFIGGRGAVKRRLVKRLAEIRQTIEQSEYFRTHEVIGSSVFMIYDDTKVGVWLIDFAKTTKLPDGVTVNHRDPWTQGNHEEGLLFGFDQLISIIEGIDVPTNPKEPLTLTKPVTISVNS